MGSTRSTSLWLQDIPFVGEVLSGHSVLVYLSWLAVVALAVLLYRHPWGLRLRGIGERRTPPRASGSASPATATA